MEAGLQDCLERVTNASEKHEVWQATRDYVAHIGFSDCSFTTARKTATSYDSPRTITSFSRKFKDAYELEGMGEIDPFLHFHCSDMKMKRIVAKDLSSFPGGSERHQMFLDHVSSNGSAGGIGIPVRTSEQDIFGGWIMSSAEPDEIVDKITGELGATVQLISVLAYERMISLGFGKSDVGSLSERERECLLWLCAGLRVSMIADKLGISESAINLYISNAKSKLGARTREQAIARAILAGEIKL
jgi:DNA-binding CsgD family transcriptional regulator